MTNDGFEQLSTVVGLSRQSNGIALTRRLIGSLREMSPGTEVSVLDVFGRRATGKAQSDIGPDDISIRRFDDTGQRLEKRDRVLDLMDVIRTLQPAAIESEGGESAQLIIPLSGEIGPLRLVVLEQVPVDPWLRAKLLQVIEIYGNLVRLMDSRERDALTGLLNRQTFAVLFELASQRAREQPNHALTLAVLDIDHFKRVNDTLGHLYGDEVLIHFARLMERSFRYTDDLFRFGGEEFVVLLCAARPDRARIALERFRNIVEKYDFPGIGRVTVSIGYVGCGENVLPTSLVDQADRALYFAKENGRNRSVDFADIDDQSTGESGGVDLF